MTTCPVCGLSYVPELAVDRRQHKRVHERHRRLCEAYGDLPGIARQEAMKEAAYDAMGDAAANVPSLVHAAETLIRAWFARSVLGSDDKGPPHPPFGVYAAGMLANGAPRPLDPDPTRPARVGALVELRRRFPPKPLPGLEPGYSYWRARHPPSARHQDQRRSLSSHG